MKNFVKFGLTLLVVFTTLGVSANDFSLFVKKGEGKTVSIAFNDTKKVHFSLYNQNGELLFEENVKGKLQRSYDLTSFPEGKYYLEAETGTKVNRYAINIEGNTAHVSENAVTEIYKPIVVNKDGMVTVTILNTEKTPVEIVLYDDNNTKLYSETVNGELSFAKKFDINATSAKNVTFIMKYNDKTFVETVAAK